MTFLLAPKRKRVIFCIEKLYVHNTLLACPISWSFKMLARILVLLALGNRASAYIVPC